MAKVTKAEYTEQLARLKEWLPPGSTLYTICESVSRSGMQRTIRTLIPYVPDHETIRAFYGKEIQFLHPNYAIATVTGYSLDKRPGYNGVKIGGCGMDMGFALVNHVSEKLYGGKRCDCGQWYLRRPARPEMAGVWEYEYQHADGWKGFIQGAQRYGSNGRPTEGEIDGSEYIYRYIANCPKCKGSGNVIGTGYQCLGKGKCPSNYHVNHRARIRCEGVERNGEQIHCGKPQRGLFSRREEEIPADWPMKIVKVGKGKAKAEIALPLTTLFTAEGDYGREVCPTCKGEGDLPNPEGPERFDLEHFDGYAIRQRWL